MIILTLEDRKERKVCIIYRRSQGVDRCMQIHYAGKPFGNLLLRHLLCRIILKSPYFTFHVTQLYCCFSYPCITKNTLFLMNMHRTTRGTSPSYVESVAEREKEKQSRRRSAICTRMDPFFKSVMYPCVYKCRQKSLRVIQ